MTGLRASATVAALGVIMLLSACDGSGRVPTSPTPAVPYTPPVPLAGGTLSGVVFEVTPGGRAPIAGVEVYCDSCGPMGHTFSPVTGSDGGYSIEGAIGGANLLLVSKAGYDLPRPDWRNPNRTSNGWIGGVNARVNGDTRFDIELVRQ